LQTNGVLPALVSKFSSGGTEFCAGNRHLKWLLAASDLRRVWELCAAWQAIRQMF